MFFLFTDLLFIVYIAAVINLFIHFFYLQLYDFKYSS